MLAEPTAHKREASRFRFGGSGMRLGATQANGCMA